MVKVSLFATLQVTKRIS